MGCAGNPEIRTPKLEDGFVRYVDVKLDGPNEGVTEYRQIGLAGPSGIGKRASCNIRWILEDIMIRRK